MKKKLLSVLLVASMVATMFVGCGSSSSSDSASEPAATTDEGAADAATNSEYKVAMITDSGDITDMSFNQTTYEAAKAFADENGVEFQYYKPTADSDDARIASFENAVADGYNVVVVPGYLFANMIKEVAETYPNVTIIALDCGEGDFGDYKLPENVCSFTYQEELAGYMAGYAAVKEGYTKLGFLGGMAVPAVIRYGYGFVQGCNDAAVELGNASDVQVNYVYGGQFFGDEAITAQMDTWYSNGTEVVFACGGGIYTSACEAAQKVDGKVIGVDSDQSGTIANQYGTDDLCITSAMKGLAPTVKSTLTDLLAGNWSNYAGKIENLGIVSGTDPSVNYVQLPTDTWSMKNFTVDDYKELVGKLYDGTITVDNTTEKMPATEITVKEYDNIH
ncbi:MAG: BMP family ABC transporter substrate-binding protein [Pseudobutyrivibrio ruminis]|uniref:BMP family ABC transporter substrate-binding protein n=1 Tax=Pseudobutyrivibrio ruminis TaxID=46206 RepID=A0A927U9C5_9FIRM|nr:BMP family ABC transporter substrate-binding protein [Pseudobutyrivibrio sp.]MBE5920786.1 BMP family ABC transporter substrate-binding protein [Pseudobutyrivibrio ruminis]MBQ6464169.1 BMP family ABC transporter substrate-binding protein [Pseudobutyrivibrio sp.]